MPWSVETLGPTVAKVLSQWDRGLRTRREALDVLLDPLATTLYLHPESGDAVATVISTLPLPVAAALVDRLAEQRTPSEWVWPPVGGIGSHGPTVFRSAEPSEVAVYEALDRWLRRRVGGESLSDTVPGAASDGGA